MAKAKLEKTESPAKLEEYYRQMLLIRRFEEKCNVAYRLGKIGGYMHTYVGMEATAVGIHHAIRPGYDTMITAYRDHPQPLLLGSDPVKVMSEIMGRSGGLSRGKGGSMHIYDIERNFYGGWGIVGGHIPLGGGLAFAAKYRGEDRVTICLLGDGAANQGVVFETMNMAGLWDLPIIFCIENNEFAMGTRLEYHAADTQLYKRGEPFGIKSERIDGMDVLTFQRDMQRIVDWVRKEQKPAWVEIMNYRFLGHGAADNDRQLYRTKEEEEEAFKRDPILKLEAVLLERNIMNREKMEAIDEEITDYVDSIYEQADASPFPDASEVYDNVYTDMEPEKGH
ncbi:MAG: pyruvate dehydrogenase (acetyl-transferring) E1 component subunit alpha [Armatimonadetes bacterium]|nr:pyruvate dehydrogenase (acetyl-transferring) E1 component subunit alpha [Armatimonadota bacterium]MBS1711757.1 pyruvate dehydrogenase (acetyl-transferring) E1 component subunit alpha [Armatimonadota bacterium]MBX3109689.1 pyruvate dehydrogenase (acetyl-transferring) E1 component subunit alpha [Fimbriimonadaceae bacterium]